MQPHVPAGLGDPSRPVGEDLFERALEASELAMCIADAEAPDCPLIWVNHAFERTTGYQSGDILGVNCRFLQGPNPDRMVASRISKALREGRAVSETLLNVRADGTTFWNYVIISPVLDDTGRLTHYVSVQTDVTDRVQAEQGRRIALRERAEANGRLRLLVGISEQLSQRLRLGQDILSGLPAILAGQFGGTCVAVGLDRRRKITAVAAARADDVHGDRAVELAGAVRTWLARMGPAASTVLGRFTAPTPRVLSLGSARVDRLIRRSGLPASVASAGRGLTVVGVPLITRAGLSGVLVLLRDGTGAFDVEEVAAVADLGGRAAMALDIGQLYAREHNAALTLQRSLLPHLPRLEGYDVAAVYQPAQTSAEVGGDWYHVLDLPGRVIGIAVGDVMGHDLNAAAAMGQLRSVLRSYAWNADPPAAVITRLDELVQGLGMARLATCFYATVTPGADASTHVVTYASAGHPPPMLLRVDGHIERLDRALTSPIGVDDGHRVVPEATTRLRPGDTLVLYTDGLVESRARSLNEGFDALAEAILGAPAASSAQQLCDHVVAELHEAGTAEDDTCVLVLRRHGPDRPFSPGVNA